jgi:hypothetical protein
VLFERFIVVAQNDNHRPVVKIAWCATQLFDETF